MKEKLITKYDDYIDFLISKSKKEQISVSSFGLWAGITCMGIDMFDAKEESPLQRDLMYALDESDKNHRVLVSWNPFECYEGCPHCIANNQKKEKYLNNHVSHFSRVKIKIAGSLHMKVAFGSDWCVVGGMNLTGSGFADCAIVSTDKNIVSQAASFFKETWESSKRVVLSSHEPRITFGKYKGTTVKEVEKKDPQYITWAKDKGLL